MRRIITVTLCSLLFSFPVLADEAITTVTEGEPVPFTGTLLNPEAAARILVESELATQRCDARVQNEVGLAKAEQELEIDVLRAQLDTCAFLSDSRLELLQTQNRFLVDEMKRYEKPQEIWWFAGGAVVGSAIVVGLVYALSPAMQTHN